MSDATTGASGTFTINHFKVVDGVLTAFGTFTGTAPATSGGTKTYTNEPASAPVVDPTAGCTILNLVLGPISLDLLGLQITTNQINLNITAVPGAGNLLGNLLCAVANLLNNSGSPLGGIANLLNQILGILQGLGL